ncbi:hypothetical protein BFDFBN_BFDFBN_15320, partial [Dysosmobacter welbionis]
SGSSSPAGTSPAGADSCGRDTLSQCGCKALSAVFHRRPPALRWSRAAFSDASAP